MVNRITFINVFPFLLMSITLFEFINPVLPLSEMKKIEGVVEQVKRGSVIRGGHNYIWIKTSEGKMIEASISLGPGDYDYLKKLTKNGKITVWMQKKWSPPPELRHEHVRQLLHESHYLTQYNISRVERVRFVLKIIFFVSLLWISFTLFIIKKKYREL